MSDIQDAVDAPLQFDRVVHTDPAAQQSLQCAACSGPVVSQYYHSAGKVLCTACGPARQAASAPDRSPATLLRASALGFGACLVGALAYWAVMAFLNLEIGIVAIAIGFIVGRAVAKGTHGRSARRHRILAVGLTYLAVGLAYAPFAFKELDERKATSAAADSTATTTTTATTPPSASTTTEGAAAASSAQARTAKASPSGGALLVGFAALLVMVLALPVVGALSSGASGILSVIIIGFGMRAAWRVAGASNRTVTGPLPVTSATAT